MENNKEQERAIKTIDKNLSVVAGAGTGKTKVLTERFVHILENAELPLGREVESIVAITFTKKASQEMKERIRREIRQNFPKDSKWRRYYRDIEKANISTIHSFCLNILKENTIQAGLDPMFEVIEEYEASRMLADSIMEVLQLQLESDPNIYNLLKTMGLDRVELLAEDINKTYNQIRTIGRDIEDIARVTTGYLESIGPVDRADLDSIRELTYILISKGTKSAKIRKVLDQDGCVSFLEEGKDENLFEILSFIKENIGANKKQQESIDQLHKYIDKVLLSLGRENLIYYKSIFKVLEKVGRSYRKKKDKFGGLDYEDLQIKTNRLLEDKKLLAKYQDRFRYIMVDEFQDTNELQKQIFYKISTVEEDLDRENLFIVGDPKQSIYGFRGADLDVFYQVEGYIGNINGGVNVNLSKNYRTVDTVLNFVNNIFSSVMGKDYSPLDAAKKSREDIDIEVISNEGLEIPDGVGRSEYERNFEAEQIAKRILELVNNEGYSYKDFAMLFRATTRNHIYERALNKYGIAHFNIGSKGFFEQQEVLDIINALRSINNIEDKIATIGFLRSNFIDLDDNTVYHIFKNPNAGVYDTMLGLVENESLAKDQAKKLRDALELYREMYIYKDAYSLNQIIANLLKKTLYTQTSLLKENARQKFANIQKFVEITKSYEQAYTGNLNEFIEYIGEVSENDESLGQIESDSTDAVKILTIHKSKGLEFPVVIIPEMASGGYFPSSKFLIDEEYGLSIDFGNTNPIYNSVKKQAKERDLKEMERVLYVAMTRAENKIIFGNQGKKSGFKKMVDGILDGQEYKKIEAIDLDPNKPSAVKMISEDLICSKRDENKSEGIGKAREDLPILYGVEDYDIGFNSRVSISKYMVFRECKRKYFLEENINVSHLENIDVEDGIEDIGSEIEGTEENYLDPVEKGIVVHEFCELYRYGKDERRLVENILMKRGIEYTEEIYLSIEKYISNYLRHYSEDMDEVYYERPFFLQMDGAYISGYMDKMAIRDGKVSVLDFKTNKLNNKSKLIDHYTPQVQLYAYVASKTLGLPVESASILFLENGEKVDIAIDSDSLLENISGIQDFIDFTIKNTKIEDYKKTKSCSEYCKYMGICKL